MFTSNEEVAVFFDHRKRLGIKPGLDRINRLLQLLDNPQDKINAIHVAGTNGKGSTINFLKNALIYNGYKVGVFASPSLDGLTGHIICNDEKIRDDEFLALLNSIYPAIQILDGSQNHPTEFEIITVLAFIYFANHVDIALIETGMGGREDTTNCFQPIVSIITNIDKDHTSFLGETINEIAYHKAGIIKKNVPAIIGEVTDDAYSVIFQEASLNDAPIFRLYDNFNYADIEQTNKLQTFKWFEEEKAPFEIITKMQGEHQVKNSSVAMMALVLLKKQGCSIDWSKSLAGIAATVIPGRFEEIYVNPTIILDGAHNPAGIQSFLKTVHSNYDHTEKHLIFAAFKDKDLEQMLRQLSPHFSTVTLTSFKHPRSASVEDLSLLIGGDKKYAICDWENIVSKIIKKPRENNDSYFFTGSLHFIAEIRRFLQ